MRKIFVPCIVVFLIHYLGFSLAPSTAVGASPRDESKYVVAPEFGSTREGKSLILLCAIGGPPAASINPPPSYIWIKDGEIIVGETGKRLTLKSLRLQDEGVYQCGDPNSEVPREEYHLNVIDAPQKFYITETGSRLRGKMLMLECHPVGVDPSSFVWLKNGKVIPGETRRTFTLHILTSEDTGDYQCGDSNPDTPKLIHHVEVLWTVPRPVISKDRPPVSGRPFYLDCIITGNYPITGSIVYTWYKSSTEIKDQSGPMLSFDNLTEADADQYKCTARDGPMDTTSPHSQAFHLNLLVAPHVHIKPMSPSSVLRGILGENLTLTCEVIHAVPEVPDNGYSWSFLPSHRGPMLPLTETTRTLMLGPLTRKDSGQYFCQAKNDQDFEALTLAGQASITVEIVYLENFSTTPDLAVNENDPVILACSVDSHPTAHIAWNVDGKEVRRVVDNLDHYVISGASCTDSANYTCHATNLDIPGLEKKGTTILLVNCRQEESTEEIREPRIIQADIAAPFDFTLPKQDSIVVVHPAGQVIITVHINCSFHIASAFKSRCLHPHCDPASHHLTFTLTQVTDKDQGHYYCFEEKQRKAVPYCNQTLIKKKQSADVSQPHGNVGPVVGGMALVGVVFGGVLIIVLRRKYMERSCSSSNVQTYEGSHDLEKLYKKCKVYLFPSLVAPVIQNEEMARDSTSPLNQTRVQVQEEAAFVIKNLIRYTLKELMEKTDLPSFVLHNTRLSKEDNIILILSRKVGVVVMIVRDTYDVNRSESLQSAVKHLMEARKVVEEKVKGLVKPESIAAVIAMPNLLEKDVTCLRRRVKILGANQDIELLLGVEKERFKQWAERLSSRPVLQVWDCSREEVDSPDMAFQEAASQFLTLTGGYHPSKSPMCSTIGESWLLTPHQMNVRDSEARFLHIWGPPGSGKTMLLIHRAREWLAHGKTVVIAVRREIYDVLLSYIADTVLREQEEETKKMLRVCRSHTTMQESVKELKRMYPDAETCIIVHTVRDTDMLEYMLQAAESKEAYAVWSVCPENLHTINKDLYKRARTLGWENANLSLCIRCSENIVKLLNILKGYPEIASCSATQAREFITHWEVLDHSGDPGHTSDMCNCSHCRERMTRILSAQGRELQWSDWIALYTGNLNVGPDMEQLCTVLHCLGVPASLNAYNDIAARPSCSLDQFITASSPAGINAWKRVVDGVDTKGKPTVHLLPVKELISLEKGNVLLVHWDERDNDPEHQSQHKKEQRLKEHRRQWTQAVSRSKGQVIFLLLTCSPARSLLNLSEAVLL